MVLGALFLSPVADRFGRRKLILLCLAVISTGMFTSALADDVNSLLLTRLITGLGVGGMLSSLTTMVRIQQRKAPKARCFCITGRLPGRGHHRWLCVRSAGQRVRMAFDLFGGGSLIFDDARRRLPVFARVFGFLVNRSGDERALERVNALLVRMRQEPPTEMPEKASSEEHRGFFDVLSKEHRLKTFLIWTAFLSVMSTWYFVANWTPKILVDAGLSRDASFSGGVILSIGGVLGGIFVGWMASKAHVLQVGAVGMLSSVALMAVFGSLSSAITPMLIVTFAVGFFLAGSMISLYAALPDMYPVQIRNTATGWALGIGRLGAVLGPNVAGVLIEAGWGRLALYAGMSVPMFLAAYAAVLLVRGFSAPTRV